MKSAVIFDMDGVISDTQKDHSKIESEILARYGINVSAEEITAKYSGRRVAEFFQEEFDKHNVSADVSKLVIEKGDRMIEKAKKHVDPIPGIYELLNDLKKNNFKMAVASASSHPFINAVLSTMKITQYFDVLTSSTDVKYGKPAPDIFLLAAQKLQKKPSECIVIEDGISGMIGSRAANIYCVGLVKDRNSKDHPANYLVESLEELNSKIISNF